VENGRLAGASVPIYEKTTAGDQALVFPLRRDSSIDAEEEVPNGLPNWRQEFVPRHGMGLWPGRELIFGVVLIGHDNAPMHLRRNQQVTSPGKTGGFHS
jgi:hypothetical protein